jgi:hypothetical protein
MLLSQFSVVIKTEVAGPRPPILYVWAGNGCRPSVSSPTRNDSPKHIKNNQNLNHVSRECQTFTVRGGGSHLKTNDALVLVNK